MRRPPPFFHRASSTGPSHGDHSGCDMNDLQTSRILISVAVALPKVCIWMVKEGSSCRYRPNFAHARPRIRRSKDVAADFLISQASAGARCTPCSIGLTICYELERSKKSTGTLALARPRRFYALQTYLQLPSLLKRIFGAFLSFLES
jgi:hypothetical protein